MTSGASLPCSAVLAAARAGTDPVRVLDLIRLCESVIVRAGLTGFNSMGSPRKDAEALVYEPLGIRDHSPRYLQAVVTRPERDAVLDLLERRVSGPTPVPYLTGEAFFAGRRFTVRPGVFLPRSALGSLLDEVVAAVPWSPSPSLLELGCGSGALGLSLALRVPGACVDLVDVDATAVEVTTENIARHRLGDRVRVHASDLFDRVRGREYDLVVGNLPYVPEALHRAGEIDAEPAQAVFRPGDGLDLVRRVLREAPEHLAADGVLVLEVGPGHQEAVGDLLGGRGRWWGQRSGVVSVTRAELQA